ncbi:peroxiredoxin family protein [Pelistega europaea]|uniref:TlpA family protein disulfide reductase n=1 Tax=Pelistega europaea TaxID=106147 RepID=A0A7Y4P4X3_9BURK|nr:TlpA disulfide reductase family protein [Pelistega europaea]NOL49936.1 TlpA family protein disulfide reductase [Pelistega europaea]
MNKMIAAITALVVVIAAGFFMFFPSQGEAQSATYHTLEGKTITSADLKGKVVLVKFWATTCTTCIAQMPDTIKHYNEYKDKGFDTVAVAMSYDNPDAIQKFSEKYQLPFTIAYDKTGELAKQFGGIRFTPVAFLLDRQGNIVKRYIANYDEQEFIQTLEKTLAQN